MRPINLRCEHRSDVPCVDDPSPRFSWALESGRRGARQTAYRVVVCERLADAPGDRLLWDSGRVASSQTIDVEYDGSPLPPQADLVWTVEVWDEVGSVSVRSAPARFRTALTEWTSAWIRRDRAHDPAIAAPTEENYSEAAALGCGPAPYLRRAFVLGPDLRRATVYATARGVFELQLNGQRVGDGVLAPGWTDYRKRIEYVTHDVTAHVRSGANALGAILGDGWYAGYVGADPKRRGAHYGSDSELRCELHVEHADGSSTVVRSDEVWRTTTGPIVYSDLLMGEWYDAREELAGWTMPGYDDSAWYPVATRQHDGTALVPERAQPIRVTEQLPAVAVTERADGARIFDFGQNFVGWVRLTVVGDRGTTVRLRFAEMLESDGSLHVANLRSARPIDTYVLKGEGTEVFEPHFTFHGFRYVEVTGLPASAGAEALVGQVVHSDTPTTGSFACSDELVNQLWRNVTWSQRGNFVSVPTDCPQRDERLGWLADAQVFLPTAALNCDVAAFMTKWGDDLLDAQSAEGAYPDVAPRIVFERDGAPAWADAGIIVPWMMLSRYGDRRLVARHWSAMERYMELLLRHNPDLLWNARRGNDYGDWLSVGAETPKDVIATAYWAQDARLMSAMADALGKADRAVHYRRLASGIGAAFNRAFVSDDGEIAGDTQTGYLLALSGELLPSELRPQAVHRLLADIERHDGHLTTGFLGVRLLCPVLADAGHADVAYRLLLTDTFPSWGYSIRHGATTIWERWNGWTPEDGFETPQMNSFNHYSLGSVVQWLYEGVAGIRSDPAYPGYERVIVAPTPGPLDWVTASYESVRGTITSSWRHESGGMSVDVGIPPGVTARIVLPPGHGELTESGVAIERADGVRAVRREGERWIVDVDSGRYVLRVAQEDPDESGSRQAPAAASPP